MSKKVFEGFLSLPTENLQKRREILEKELKSVIVEMTFTGLKKDLKEFLNKLDIKNQTVEVSWDFYGEYDDEGGTTYYAESACVKLENGKYVYISDFEDIVDDEGHEIYVNDWYYDMMSDYRHELYKYYITEITVEV